MKPYQQIPIQECFEPLVPIPPQLFALVSPHPYQKLGAPYGDKSPFYLRQGVLDSLIQAQKELQNLSPGIRIQIFDAYRPVAVQQFMVDYSFKELARSLGFNPNNLIEVQRQSILEQVYQFWAPPSLDPATPPPHSTGAAVDVTLVDATGQPLDMGSPIDEISPRSYPDYFANSSAPVELQYHRSRQLLRNVMLSAGFAQHQNEWWHFCKGDQMWAWLTQQKSARYGRVE
ncbi:MAG: M15 family metallopeptidase [Oscillatoriaceae bacterium SKW80]|nr:M15 family metallopeptidase [Oscillatoriaceae bacterium SKYG93]MCX8121633.1 M15 family metallopeptidase [Oscillatoriaceae bacterium SKW80]MDW8453941.1 M15 family metallopeptidase [Oscillatoriaceae cyanobacterium SKYGB_i_bin93]HIK28814.1 M15 family metallopeptidase [Oscillatoriaceae cyanobacterium M7585_C2015_266]